ncbi:MFS transporter, partial [Mycobacterium kansasii]
ELLDHQIKPLLYVAIVPAVLSVALMFLVRERGRPVPGAQRQSMWAGVRTLPRRYWRVTAVLIGFSVVNFPDALLLLRLN